MKSVKVNVCILVIKFRYDVWEFMLKCFFAVMIKGICSFFLGGKMWEIMLGVWKGIFVFCLDVVYFFFG